MPLFEVKGLSAGYSFPLVREISFSAEAGELIGILGRNGCGKTTLLKGIAGSIRRYAGEIWIDGRNCAALPLRQQARRLAVLPQQTEMIEGIRVRELIAMGRYPYGGMFAAISSGDEGRIEEAAQTLGVAHLLDADCALLSQGQRQLALIARCLIQDTPVMLLDEPNAALDYDNTHAMFQTVRSQVKEKGKAALMVLHDPELALHYCDRILIMKDGRLCMELSPAEAPQETAEEALRKLYPGIIVRKDPFDGYLRCYTYSQKSEEEHQC